MRVSANVVVIDTFVAHAETPRFKGFRVRTSTLRAELIELGGIVARLEVPDRRGVFGNVLLGCPTPADYLADHPHFNCLVGRYANRMTNARFTLDGTTWRLDPNVPPHHLHGGRNGFSTRIWVGERDGDGVVFRLRSPAGEAGYPGALNVQARYGFQDAEVTLDIRAETDAPTPVSLTSHHYYNLSARRGGTVADHEITMDADAFLPVSEALTQLGERRDVAGTPFDLRQGARLGARLASADPQLRLAGGFDHTFVLREGSFRRAAVVRHPESGRVLAVATNQPGVQLYTGNSLHEARRWGHPRHGALCLETQQFPDAPNHVGYPNAILRPGQVFHARTTFAFAVDNAVD